jgi:flagellar biogenesis protein FliO
MTTARIARVASGVALLSHAGLLLAAESAPLTQGDDVITAAGVIRVVIVFAIVAALGVAVILGLRRVLPRVSGAALGGGALRIVERTNLGPATRVHLVQVDGERLLVAESRTSLAMVVLGRTAPQPPP